MLRASASFFNGGKYSDEGTRTVQAGLPKTCTSMRRNIPPGYSGVDGRLSRQLASEGTNGQTIEPYAHVQDNGYRDKALRARSLAVSGSAGISGPASALRRLAAQSQSRRRVSTYL